MQNYPLTIFISHASELLTDHRAHGDGVLAYGFIRRLAERGHRLHVAAPVADLQTPLPPNVTLHLLQPRLRGKILFRLEYMLRSRLLLNRLRRRVRFDLVHQLNPVVRGLSLALLGSGLPVVLGPFFPEWPEDADAPRHSLVASLRARGRRAIRACCLWGQQRQADAILVATPNASELFHRPERLREKIFFVNNGVDAHLFTPAEAAAPNRTQTPDDAQHILFVANLHRRKGILTLLDAFALVAAQLPAARLTVVGSGGIEAEVHARAAQLACRDRITFVPHLPRIELPAALRACTVCCLPSYGEPLSNITLEAMACGKPVVVTDAGGLGLLVQAENGRKVRPRNVPALAGALREILVSPALQSQMGRANRLLIEERYAWERVIEQLESAYQVVCDRRALAAHQRITSSLPRPASLGER